MVVSPLRGIEKNAFRSGAAIDNLTAAVHPRSPRCSIPLGGIDAAGGHASDWNQPGRDIHRFAFF
jgi:hypothetical protein